MIDTLAPAILKLLFLAIMVWGIVGVIRSRITNRRTGLIALGAGVILALIYQVDVLGALGLSPALPWPGLNQVLLALLNPLLSGILVGGGPSYIIDLFRKLQGAPGRLAAIQQGGTSPSHSAPPPGA